MTSRLLLRNATTLSRWQSINIFMAAVIYFVVVYGGIGGVFIGIVAA